METVINWIAFLFPMVFLIMLISVLVFTPWENLGKKKKQDIIMLS